MSTGLVYSPEFLNHMTGFDHPERPRRVSYVMEKMEESGLLQRVRMIEPRPVEVMWLQEVHKGHYVEHLRSLCAQAPTLLDTDTVLSTRSLEVATYAAGGAVQACELVMEGRLRNAFCLVRPPGHHAERDHGMGFCLLNNVAVAARYLQLEYGLKRILIVDWDVHHGNGTQDIFYHDPGVFYFSAHQYPFYPGTGAAGERGAGEALGTTLNCPMRVGSGDTQWLDAFYRQLLPAMEAYRPQFVLVSAGFDAHWEDLISQQKVTDEGFRQMTEVVLQVARQYCGGRLVSLLEGGYDVSSLSRSLHVHLEELLKAGGN